MKRNNEWEALGRGGKLYVDALNFSAEFGFTVKRWGLQRARTCISRFVDATRRSGVTIVIFIDAGIGSEEGSLKWRSRLEANVQEERRGVLQGTNVFMGDMFRERGVTVFYSEPQQDLDDCLASHATHDGANILSNDGDYFRYIGRKYKQYGKWKIDSKGDLIVRRRREKKEKTPEARRVLDPAPLMLSHDPSLVNLESTLLYFRGAPSPLVKLCGNPHGKVIALRAALYARLGIEVRIREEWPDWNENEDQLMWHVAEVEPDSSGLSLFEKTPEDLFVRFFGYEARPTAPDLEDWEWENHIFACRAIICELWLMGQQNRGTMSLLTFLRDKETTLSSGGKIRHAFCRPSLDELAPSLCEEEWKREFHYRGNEVNENYEKNFKETIRNYFKDNEFMEVQKQKKEVVAKKKSSVVEVLEPSKKMVIDYCIFNVF